MFCLVSDAERFCWRATVAFLPAFEFIDWFSRPLNWYVRAGDVWLPNPLEAEPGAEVVALALAVPVLAAFALPRICMEALILPVEVLADQPVHSDTTTEAAARLLLGHTNSADGETNR
jgi:hypothetical protein